MSSMKKRISLECGDLKPNEVVELNLDNCKSQSLEDLTDGFTNLYSLSLNNVGVQSFVGMPFLPNLEKLEAGDNLISSDLQILAEKCPKLKLLNLSGNSIKSVETLRPLSALENLTHLDLYLCAVTKDENYRSIVFSFLPSLISLDGYDADGQEVDIDDETNCASDEETEEEEIDEESEDDEDYDDENVDDGNKEVNTDNSTATRRRNKRRKRNEDEEDDVDEECDDEDELGLSAIYKNMEDDTAEDADFDGSALEEEEDQDFQEEDEDEDPEDDSTEVDQKCEPDGVVKEVIKGDHIDIDSKTKRNIDRGTKRKMETGDS